MKKLNLAVLLILLMFFISCTNEKDVFSNGFIEVYDADTGELIFPKDRIFSYKSRGNKRFVFFHTNGEDLYGLYFVNDKIERKIEGLSSTNIITSDLKYVVSCAYENVDKNDPIMKKYTNIIIYEIESGKILKEATISEITRNTSYNGYAFYTLQEKGKNITITMKDDCGEIFEIITVSKNNWDVIREDITYSKNHPEIDLSSVK